MFLKTLLENMYSLTHQTATDQLAMLSTFKTTRVISTRSNLKKEVTLE